MFFSVFIYPLPYLQVCAGSLLGRTQRAAKKVWVDYNSSISSKLIISSIIILCNRIRLIVFTLAVVLGSCLASCCPGQRRWRTGPGVYMFCIKCYIFIFYYIYIGPSVQHLARSLTRATTSFSGQIKNNLSIALDVGLNFLDNRVSILPDVGT